MAESKEVLAFEIVGMIWEMLPDPENKSKFNITSY